MLPIVVAETSQVAIVYKGGEIKNETDVIKRVLESIEKQGYP